MKWRDSSGKNLDRQTLDSLTTAVLVCDANGDLALINPAAEMLLGISARKAVGQSLERLLDLNPEILRQCRLTRETAHPVTEREVTLRRTDGSEATVDLTVSTLSTAKDRFQILVELQQVDRLLRIAREESLLSQNTATRALLRGMAHEIKNPLGGLRGAAQLLEADLPNEDLKEYTRIIIGEADRLQSLLDRMLGPRDLPQKRMVNIHEVMERVRTLVLAETGEATLRIERDYDPSIPEIYADFDQLVQATLNIVRNAVQAMDGEGRVRLRTRILSQFTIGHRRYRQVSSVEIEDDGPGIPEDLREKIFLPMITTRAEGTGLGLSISQSIVGRHGGLIECSSRPGRTIFTLTIPMEETS
jgi:two-component system nitrogen regulation sensor histidine kinase GlnL